jgi:hypothetical protein
MLPNILMLALRNYVHDNEWRMENGETKEWYH